MAELKVPASRETASIVAKLSKALRKFGALPVEGGALAQAWMPTKGPDGSGAILQTKGLPYCLVGPGDMLALFRCLSCKYSFTSDLNQLALMGAPGRVFLSGEAETSDNVQQYSVSIYLRVKDATACRVTSTVLLPIFADTERNQPAAVLEVTQFDGFGASYTHVFEWARKHLEEAGLYTPQHLETRTFEMQSHALSISFFSSRDSALGCIFTDNSAAPAPNLASLRDLTSGVGRAAGEALKLEAPEPAAAQAPGQPGGSEGVISGENRNSSGGDSEEAGDESGKDAQRSHQEDENWEARGGAGGAGPSGHSKAVLTRDDLERHFGYGLKEAATRLGVCNTTLKRACRRHGIMKWPRRELLKNAKLQKLAAAKASDAGVSQGLDGSPSSSMPAFSASGLGSPQLKQLQQLSFRLPSGTAASTSAPEAGPQKDGLLHRIPSLQHAASSSYLPGVTQPSSLLQAIRGGYSELPVSNPLSAPEAAGLRQWPALSQSTSAAATQNPTRASAMIDPDPASASTRRGSLGIAEVIFGESDGTELGSFLGEWEQQLATLPDPQPMEGTGQAQPENRAEQTPEARQREADGRFPEVPESWRLEQGGAQGGWNF